MSKGYTDERNVQILWQKSKADCCGCAMCAAVCPKQCITMRADGEGFMYPQIDLTACIQCGQCKQVCPPLLARDQSVPTKPQATQPCVPEVYAAYNRNDMIRLASSSGGIFTILAEWVIRQGGVVFGAAMRENQRTVAHIAVDTEEGLEKLRGSKYLQSDVEGIYPQVQMALQAGRQVLFSGTPCQIEALRAYLGRGYVTLLCVDLICHGVASPKVWQKYVFYQESHTGASVRQTFFRQKEFGWKTAAISLEFSNDTVYKQTFSKDLFMQAYPACLRPSCHSCAFKKINRLSDITLADFWGIQNVAPLMDDDKGTSLVLIHSAKGKKIFAELRNKMCILPASIEKAVAGNPSMTSSTAIHKNREKFFAMLEELPFDLLVRRYAAPRHTLKRLAAILLRKAGLYFLVKNIYAGVKTRKHYIE